MTNYSKVLILEMVVGVFALAILIFISKMGDVTATETQPQQEATQTVTVTTTKPQPLIEEPKRELEADEFVFIPDVALDESSQRTIFEVCEEYSVPFAMVLAIIERESTCNPQALSSAGDSGLMQIARVNHANLQQVLGITDFFDIRQNVTCGCYMLKALFDKYEEPHLVLMAYNMGEGGAKKSWNSGVYSTKYSRGIVDRMTELQAYIDSNRVR